MPFTLLPLQPVVDCARSNSCGQRPKVVWRRAGDGSELAKTPVGQRGDVTRRVAHDDVVGVGRFGPEGAGLNGALLDPRVPCTGGLVERVNAGVPFIGWARCPFPVSRVRRNSGHTTPGHVGAPFSVALGRRGGGLQRRATWRGGQDDHSERYRKLTPLRSGCQVQPPAVSKL